MSKTIANSYGAAQRVLKYYESKHMHASISKIITSKGPRYIITSSYYNGHRGGSTHQKRRKFNFRRVKKEYKHKVGINTTPKQLNDYEEFLYLSRWYEKENARKKIEHQHHQLWGKQKEKWELERKNRGIIVNPTLQIILNEEKKYAIAKRSNIFERLMSAGYSEKKIENTLEKLRRDGEIYEARPGSYRTV